VAPPLQLEFVPVIEPRLELEVTVGGPAAFAPLLIVVWLVGIEHLVTAGARPALNELPQMVGLPKVFGVVVMALLMVTPEEAVTAELPVVDESLVRAHLLIKARLLVGVDLPVVAE